MSTKSFRQRLLYYSLGAYLIFALFFCLVWQQVPWLTQFDLSVNAWFTNSARSLA